MYFYNGAGVGAGDFNNDGLIDLFFAANQGDNKLYLNTGNLRFKDVTAASKIPQDGGWSTGVSVIDINNDGLLDLYICRVGNYETLHSHNLLLVCQGIDKNGVPSYIDQSKEYGLDFSGFSTQAAFLDYDMDGDIDMFLLNHSVHENGNFRPRKDFSGTYHPLSGDRIYRNDGDHFTDVTKQTGIYSTAISYGLGIAVADINLDGYPDIYVGNDFHENDYLYINQKNGTFSDESASRLMHTSQYSMGVDVGDINNDGFPEIVSMDMLPSDPYILKRSLGEDAYDVFFMKIGYGYNYQYSRNNLQLNRRNGMFSEVGLYAGIYATDWSWAPLWMDFDNDGLKDLFISNGIPKRLNDIDYVNYVSDDVVQAKINSNRLGEKEMALINQFPQIKLPNKFYKNRGEAAFDDVQTRVKGDRDSYSNGAVYADFDNDGDLDIVVNNIDEAALLYENKSNNSKARPYVEIALKGPEKNVNALGAKVVMFANGGVRTYEKYPARGFMSGMETPLHIGLYDTKADSVFLVWPDNSYQFISLPKNQTRLSFSYKKGLPRFDYSKITQHWQSATKPVTDITAQCGLKHKHIENPFVEFDRERLMPHMVSTEGPALSVADINHDGLEDIFIGSSKGNKSSVFLQNSNWKFIRTEQPALDNDSTYEDADAAWTDINKDGNMDLVVASGGNEYYGADKFLLPRVYLNNGKGKLSKAGNAFGELYVNASCIEPYDFNGDGYEDLFIAGRTIPWEYGATPQSYLLLNDHKGNFKDVTQQYAKELSHIGMVTQALWFDLDKNGYKDLLICCEWGGINAFMNSKGTFTKKTISDKKGWWNFILPYDLDNDGDIDLIAGNLGLNSRLKASSDKPVRLYYNDFDANGKKEQVLTYFLNGKELPFANKMELEKQMPFLKKKYLRAEEFAKASLKDMLPADKLQSADVLTADYFCNAIIINKGNLNFETKPMPWQAQLTAYRDAVIVNANNDNLPDILLAGNYYENNIAMGRSDADFGTVLINHGKGNFTCETLNGLVIKGQVRHISKINIGGKEAFVLARNNDSTMVIRFKR